MKLLAKKVKHLIEYVIILLFFKFFKMLGYEKSSNLMGKIMVRMGKILPFYNRIYNNIKLSSLHIPENKIAGITCGALNNFGRYIAEFQFIHGWSKKDLNSHVKIIGEEYLKNTNKIPSMVLTSHMANWEVIVRYFYFRKEKVMAINRSMNNPYVNRLLFKYRSNRKNMEYVDKNNASKKLIEAAQKKILVGILADVKLQGKMISFLGRKAESSDIIARLHDKYKMQIIPTKVERYQNTKFKITFYPPVKFNPEDLKNKDYTAMTVQIHKIYESWIAENPSQWYWLHNRWKIRK